MKTKRLSEGDVYSMDTPGKGWQTIKMSFAQLKSERETADGKYFKPVKIVPEMVPLTTAFDFFYLNPVDDLHELQAIYWQFHKKELSITIKDNEVVKIG
jgi:hypothetical protein